MISEESYMLAAVKEVKKAFTATFSSSAEFSFTHLTTGGSGYNARATVTKLEDPSKSTATSRCYSLKIDLELPYTQDNGRIKAEMTVSHNAANQASARFTMLYSASTSANAYAVYQADTWVASMITALFPTFTMEKISENYTQDQNLKRLMVVVVYNQVLYAASLASGVDAKIVNARLVYGLEYVPVVNNLITSASAEQTTHLMLTLSYFCVFDRALVTTADGITDIWQKNLRGRLIGQATTVLKPTVYKHTAPGYYIKSERVQVNPSDYSLNASLIVGCRLAGVHIISLQEGIQIVEDNGIQFSKLWDGQEGTYFMYSLGKTRELHRIVQISQLGEQPKIPELPKNFGVDSGEWVLVRKTTPYSKSTEGIEYTGTGDSATAIKTPIFHVRTSEVYRFVANAGSVNTVIGQLTGQGSTQI
jgi:hypothetical protein